MDIIMYLIQFIQYQHKQICWLLNFICRYIPLKQWALDDSCSPKYQKFKINKLPVIKPFIRQDWQFLLEYYQWKYTTIILTPTIYASGRKLPFLVLPPFCSQSTIYLFQIFLLPFQRLHQWY